MNIDNIDNSGIIERIKQFIDYKSITTNKFEVHSGIARGYLARLKGSVGSDKLNGIMIAYPELNIEWLIAGKGEMLKSNTAIPLSQSSSQNTIKYFPSVNGSMGGVEFLDSPDESSIDIILPGFNECKFAINAYGDSMYPVIKSGQVVLLMEWKESFIDWGHIYLVVTKNGYRAIKYLRPSEKEGFIRCESENKEFNPAFEVEINDIHRLFLVKGWVCRDII